MGTKSSVFLWGLLFLFGCSFSFYLGRSINRENPAKEPSVKVVVPIEVPSVPEETPEDSVEIKDEEETSQEILEDIVRPSSFSVFRASFEVRTQEPEEPGYAQKQAKELKLLVKSIPSVKEVYILRVEGVDGEQSFPIETE